jgi:methylase of polypeptide subunit release factors
MTFVLMTDAAEVSRLREALAAAGYTVDGCLELLGPLAYAALSRNETVPALRATRESSPREILVRLFLLQASVTAEAAAAALPLQEALAGGLLERDGDEVRALVDIRPYAEADADWWVVSDLGAGLAGGRVSALRPDHVLGVGGASTTLAQLTVRPAVHSALDLGTGCGVQALHLTRHAGRVTATDLNPRALDFARLTVALSGEDHIELRQGSLFEPVADRRFDLVVSNPPFVISPGERFTYRDSGLAGDELCRRLVAQAPDHLLEGGWCQTLANWLHVRGEDWRERVAQWVVPTGCDAWVVQRELQDPAEYVELWLRDSGDAGGPHYRSRYDAWLDHFEAMGVEAVGFGWITLHASGSADPYVRIEELTHQVDQPLGPHVLEWFARHDFLRETSDRDLLASRLAVAPDARLEHVAAPVKDGTGWEMESQRVRLTTGLRRSGAVDPVGAAVLAECDGIRPLGQVLDSVAAEHRLSPAELRDGAMEAVRALVEEGFLTRSR